MMMSSPSGDEKCSFVATTTQGSEMRLSIHTPLPRHFSVGHAECKRSACPSGKQVLDKSTVAAAPHFPLKRYCCALQRNCCAVDFKRFVLSRNQAEARPASTARIA